MVTIAQGKFSKPRPNLHKDVEIAVQKANRTKVAADPIEKAEADIVKFMDTATQEPSAPQSDDTQILTDLDLLVNAHSSANNWEDDTQIVPETAFQEHQDATPASKSPNASRPVPTPVPPEEAYEEETTFLQRNQKPILIGGTCVILTLLLIIIGMVVSLKKADADNGRILDNVIAAGVDIGGMTPEKAKIAIYNATAETYTLQSMNVTLPDTVMTFSPEDTGITLDVDSLVEAAFKYGRVGTEAEIEQIKAQTLVGQYVMDVIPYLQLDAEYIHASLADYGEEFNSSYLSSSYTFEGSMPGLTADTFDENVPCQTLVLKIGSPGRYLDVEKVYTRVLEAYSNNVFQVDASEAPEEMPELPDLDAIFEKYCSTPVDAYMDMQTFEITGEIYGYTFDLEEAKKLLSEAEFGSVIEIQMEYMIPEVTSATLQASRYSDVLGLCETKVTKNDNRCINISLACQAINGMILEPGDEFSFNDVVGERTAERGYRAAPAYSSGKTVQELGGGICQVSSTLYYAVLLADLEVIDRTAHSYASSYIDLGMDATVSWGGPEFKFRNSTNYPIRLEAELIENIVKIQIMGTDDKDYYIEMEYEIIQKVGPTVEYEEYPADNAKGYTDGRVLQEWTSGYYIDTYKHKIHKETKEEISVEYVARSVYKPRNKIVVKIVAPATEAPTPAPTTPPATEVPTPAPTTPPATQAPAPTPTTPPATQAPAADNVTPQPDYGSNDVPDVNAPEA